MSKKLYILHECGSFGEADDKTIIEESIRIAERKVHSRKLMNNPRDAKQTLAALLAHKEHEVFCVAHLDKRHRLIKFEQMFRGTVDGASVHPREVVKQALALNSAAVIFVHNHPSGVAEPSQPDELITMHLKKALELVDIRVLDHLIVAGANVVSFAERGMI